MKKFYYQVVSIENVKILKYHTFWEKNILFAVSAKMKIKNI